MSLTMKQEQAVTKQLAVEYKRGRKKQRGKIGHAAVILHTL